MWQNPKFKASCLQGEQIALSDDFGHGLTPPGDVLKNSCSGFEAAILELGWDHRESS
jgi:hypothetical protein